MKQNGRKDPMGFQTRRVGFDVGSGVGLAAAIGIPGLAFYLAARAIGINTTVIPEALPAVWWTVPVLLLSAVQNAFLEEVVVVGYLMNRLREMSWRVPMAVAASALLRGSYHLYQGFGGFIGNAVMGIVFALFFIRFKRVTPLDNRARNPGFRCVRRLRSPAQSSGVFGLVEVRGDLLCRRRQEHTDHEHPSAPNG